MINKPLISIVTVSYNAKETIEDTILSVLNQTYHNIEYIIIDGGSTDGTVDIIKKYSDKISYWISEPDKGIYDAMNKGIDVSTGDWINFMNSGDVFFNNHVLENVFYNRNTTNIDVIYGDRIMAFSESFFLQKPSPINNFDMYFPIFHQSTFVRTNLMKHYKYDLAYKICSDYHFLYTLWKQNKKFQYLDIIMSICDCELGVSSQYRNEYTRTKENLLIQNKINIIILFIVYLKSEFKILLNKMFPKFMKSLRIKNITKSLVAYDK